MTVQAELAALAKALGEVQTSFEQISKSKRANSAIERARRHADKALGELAGGLVRQPRRVPRVPCLLTHTATTPSVRICTLDPRIDVAQSKLLHDDGALTISKSWPLEQLLKNKAGSLVVDVGAGIGYFALLSAALGARVRAFEEDADMVDLLHTSAGLNTFKHAIAADHGLVTKLSGTGGGVASEHKPAGRPGAGSGAGPAGQSNAGSYHCVACVGLGGMCGKCCVEPASDAHGCVNPANHFHHHTP